MASGLSMPIGFKNATDGNLQIAIDAMFSAQAPHSFLGIDESGQTCIVSSPIRRAQGVGGAAATWAWYAAVTSSTALLWAAANSGREASARAFACKVLHACP